MKALEDAIRTQGRTIGDKVLKVDAFLNHQVDPKLMRQMGETWNSLYHGDGVTKVITIESSGISPALMTADEMDVALVFARKSRSLTMNNDVYTASVYSYTKEETNTITVSTSFLSREDCVLIIDDFLANGEAALGLAKIVEQAGAQVAGFGIVIEKSFQPGRQKLEKAGYRVESLARILRFDEETVEFLHDETLCLGQ